MTKTIFIFQSKVDPSFILPCGAETKKELNRMITCDKNLYKDFDVVEIII